MSSASVKLDITATDSSIKRHKAVTPQKSYQSCTQKGGLTYVPSMKFNHCTLFELLSLYLKMTLDLHKMIYDSCIHKGGSLTKYEVQPSAVHMECSLTYSFFEIYTYLQA